MPKPIQIQVQKNSRKYSITTSMKRGARDYQNIEAAVGSFDPLSKLGDRHRTPDLQLLQYDNLQAFGMEVSSTARPLFSLCDVITTVIPFPVTTATVSDDHNLQYIIPQPTIKHNKPHS